MAAIHEKAALRWGEENARALFTMIRTKAMAEQISRFLAKGATSDQMRRAVNHELALRLGKTGRGQRRTKHLIQGDLTRAAISLCTDDLPPSRFKMHGLKLDQTGFLVDKQGPPPPDMDSGDDESEGHGEGTEDDDDVEYENDDPDSDNEDDNENNVGGFEPLKGYSIICPAIGSRGNLIIVRNVSIPILILHIKFTLH